MKKFFVLNIILTSLILTSCFKEEDPIEPFDRGERKTVTIGMTKDYIYQVYYDLDEDTVAATNHKLDYDLAFESSGDGFRILLNTSTFMTAARTDQTSLDEVTGYDGLDFRFDVSSGNLDSTAVGDWFSIAGADTIFPGIVYVINRGYDAAGVSLGYKKIIEVSN